MSFSVSGLAGARDGLSDVTDARMLAKQLFWAADTDAARNDALNVVNDDLFRWSWTIYPFASSSRATLLPPIPLAPTTKAVLCIIGFQKRR